ncbi:MAG: hypothetical protein J4F29_10475 [Candidatus Latescibacteria bacterium]|nr:hypothetical protein [Candidatus Latescibacterota bacterium]
MKISPEHRQQLDEQGYVIIPDVLSESEISHYRALLLHLAEQERGDGQGPACAVAGEQGQAI